MSTRSEVRAGAMAVAPMLIGVLPFGLVAGATPVALGYGVGAAAGFSTIVFAGASQLAAIDVLGDGGSAIVAAVAAWMINLRLVLYSASLAPYLASVPLRQRLLIGYVLTDQAYVVAINRWTGEDDPRGRVPFILGAGFFLYVMWFLATIVGGLVGNAVPEEIPLYFAVPLVFIALLVPVVRNAPSLVAAVVGGGVTVAATQLGAGHLALVAGALSGIAAGTVAELVLGDADLGEASA